jgi:hypothetical protein
VGPPIQVEQQPDAERVQEVELVEIERLNECMSLATQ